MSFLKKGTAPYRAGATTWGVRDSETGEVVGRLRSAQRDWWDDLNVWGVGQSADDIQARKDWHQGLGQKMQRNYRVFLDQGQPEDYGFSAGEILGSAAPVDPFSRLPGQGNTTRVDPSADGIRAFLEDETAETREKADLGAPIKILIYPRRFGTIIQQGLVKTRKNTKVCLLSPKL